MHKHVVLLALLESLQKKSTPFFVLDTHAGRGLFDLKSPDADRGAEWLHGIGRLHDAALESPLLQRFLAIAYSTPDEYRGSPLITAHMLRENDRAVFVELLAEEARALKTALGQRRHVAVREDDGYGALKAYLPPKENRGLVLIDPPFEKDSEFADITSGLQLAHERWPNGIYCIWYPIKTGAAEQRLFRGIVASGIKKVLRAELMLRPADSPLGLNGSGLLIVNPPWQFDEQLRVVSAELLRVLATDAKGAVRIEWLAGE